MKIILSRKGFDTVLGKIPSPIFSDGSLVSFPIPEADIVSFDDIIIPSKGISYRKFIDDLCEGYKNIRQEELLNSIGTTCHLDPDIYYNRKTVIDNWKPAFGQCNQMGSLLLNTLKIEENDIFLFFGRFHKVELVDGKYQYVKNTSNFYDDNDLHIIWGYLQVGKIITSIDEMKKECPWHPHSYSSNLDGKIRKNNVIFVARDRLSFNESFPGAGLLPFNENRVLTKVGESMSKWEVNKAYDVSNIISNRRNSDLSKNTIYYRGRWQELPLKENEITEEWVKRIINY